MNTPATKKPLCLFSGWPLKAWVEYDRRRLQQALLMSTCKMSSIKIVWERNETKMSSLKGILEKPGSVNRLLIIKILLFNNFFKPTTLGTLKTEVSSQVLLQSITWKKVQCYTINNVPSTNGSLSNYFPLRFYFQRQVLTISYTKSLLVVLLWTYPLKTTGWQLSTQD